jgi:hypothetical protein
LNPPLSSQERGAMGGRGNKIFSDTYNGRMEIFSDTYNGAGL